MKSCANCLTPLHEDVFRGHYCAPVCWANANPIAADRIIRRHFKRAKQIRAKRKDGGK